MKIEVKNKVIGDNSPIFVVEEIGINYNGDIRTAKKLILNSCKIKREKSSFV